MNTTFAQVNTALYDILGLLTGSGKPLQTRYDHPPKKLTAGGFPAAFPISLGSREEILDTISNEIAMDFIVRVVIRDKDAKASYDQMLALMDSIPAEFRKDDHDTLGGLVDKFNVTSEIKPFRTEEGDASLIGFDLLVTAGIRMSTLQ